MPNSKEIIFNLGDREDIIKSFSTILYMLYKHKDMVGNLTFTEHMKQRALPFIEDLIPVLEDKKKFKQTTKVKKFTTDVKKLYEVAKRNLLAGKPDLLKSKVLVPIIKDIGKHLLQTDNLLPTGKTKPPILVRSVGEFFYTTNEKRKRTLEHDEIIKRLHTNIVENMVQTARIVQHAKEAAVVNNVKTKQINGLPHTPKEAAKVFLDLQDKLEAFNKKHLGTKNPKKDAVDELKAKNEGFRTNWNKFNREKAAAYKKILYSIFDSRAEELISSKELHKLLDDIDVPPRFHKSFKGKFDREGWPYTPAGLKLDTTITTDDPVVINKNYEEGGNGRQWYMKVVTTNGTLKSVYTMDHKKRAKQVKSQHVNEVLENYDEFRETLQGHFKSNNPLLKLLSMMVIIVDDTQGRIGSRVPKEGSKEAYGISTLKVKHIKVKGNKITIKYRGKDAIEQHHILTTPDVIEVINDLIEGKGKEDFVFTFPTKTTPVFTNKKGIRLLTAQGLDGQRISSDLINFYLKEQLKLPITIHKVRTLKATMMFKENLLDKNPPELRGLTKITAAQKRKAVNDYLKKVGDKIAKELGHTTRNMTIKEYTDPIIFWLYYQKYQVKPDTMIDKLIKTHVDMEASFSDHPNVMYGEDDVGNKPQKVINYTEIVNPDKTSDPAMKDFAEWYTDNVINKGLLEKPVPTLMKELERDVWLNNPDE